MDCFSRTAWVEPLKNKSGPEAAGALKSLFAGCFTPESPQTDLGTDFYNKDVQSFLESKNLNLFSTNNAEIIAGQVERLNRTLSTKLFRYFSHNQTRRWVDIIQQLIEGYNRSPHRSLSFHRPNEITQENTGKFRSISKKVRKWRICLRYFQRYLLNWTFCANKFEKGTTRKRVYSE